MVNFGMVMLGLANMAQPGKRLDSHKKENGKRHFGFKENRWSIYLRNALKKPDPKNKGKASKNN